MPTTQRMMGPATALLVSQLMVLLSVAVGGRRESYNTISSNVTIQKLLRAGVAVEAWTPCSEFRPWELGSLVEGDLLDVEMIERGQLSMNSNMKMVTTEEKLKWPNKTVPIFVEAMDFPADQIKIIIGVLDEINTLSCVHLRGLSGPDEDYVRIVGKKEGCYVDHWGRKGGEQIINLQVPGCLDPGTVYHLVFHALGFWHEHNNPLRDDYIRINWDNVEKGKKSLLEKYDKKKPVTDQFFRYDYQSVMHAGRKYCSGNGKDTIETHDELTIIGQRLKPTYFDIQKLRKLYDCEHEDITIDHIISN